MGYLVTEIIVLLVAAALIGVVLGWALFGGAKNKKGASAVSSDNAAQQKALNEAKAKANEAEGRADNLGERVEALEKELAAAKSGSGAAAAEERIAALEGQLRSRDAELAAVASSPSGEVSALELMQVKSRLEEKTEEAEAVRRDFEAYKATGGKLENVLVVEELQAEIAELKATLSSSSGLDGADDAAKAEIARLNGELTKTKASLDEVTDDHEADQQALEEQDAAIDKLTRELVAAQQRIAELEGTTVAAPPQKTNTLNALPPMPAPAPVVPAPVAEIDDDEDDEDEEEEEDDDDDDEDGATMAVSLEQLVAAGLGRHVPAGTPAVAPPAPPAPPVVEAAEEEEDEEEDEDDDDDEDGATMAIDLSKLVGQINPATDVGLSRAPATVSDPEENESTVALVLGDVVGFIDNSATLQQSRPATGAPDDLKLIKGIGPVSETRLNDYGITTYRALAALSDDEIGAVADHVKMSLDRVRPWVDQAREMVEG